MKLLIDTEKLLISFNGEVNLADLFEKLKVLFPEGEWKKYSIEGMLTKIIIKEREILYPTYPYPWSPQVWPYIPDQTSVPTDPPIIYESSANGVFSISY